MVTKIFKVSQIKDFDYKKGAKLRKEVLCTLKLFESFC